jgi:hypothetical protein
MIRVNLIGYHGKFNRALGEPNVAQARKAGTALTFLEASIVLGGGVGR